LEKIYVSMQMLLNNIGFILSLLGCFGLTERTEPRVLVLESEIISSFRNKPKNVTCKVDIFREIQHAENKVKNVCTRAMQMISFDG
jgi:hypothetical protein